MTHANARGIVRNKTYTVEPEHRPRAADEATFACPAQQPRAELVEARLEPAAALRQAQGEVAIASALHRHHESGLRLACATLGAPAPSPAPRAYRCRRRSRPCRG